MIQNTPGLWTIFTTQFFFLTYIIPRCIVQTQFIYICLILQEKKDVSKDKASIDDSAFEALEKDFQEVSYLWYLGQTQVRYLFFLRSFPDPFQRANEDKKLK